MFWKIITTIFFGYILFKSFGLFLISTSFLMDGEMARYSSIFQERFAKRYFLKSDTINLLMNIILCMWCIIFILIIWKIEIFDSVFLLICMGIGIMISILSFQVNYTITEALHDTVTNFKHVKFLPDDVKESYSNARDNIEITYFLPFIIGITAVILVV